MYIMYPEDITMYQMNNQIGFTAVASDGKLKLYNAAVLMIDCCQFQEYEEKAFCNFLRERAIAVFLSSLQIDIIRMPAFREKVRTTVKIYDCKSIYGLRRLTVHDESGALCLIANATGAFFDLNAGKAVKLDPELFPVSFDTAEPMECLPRKIPVPREGGVELNTFTVGRSDVDFNGHLTTPVYFAVAADALPEDFFYDRVRVEFKQQAKPGDIIIPELFVNGSTAVVDLKNGTGQSFAVAEFSTISG